jgi:hypothetical protein
MPVRAGRRRKARVTGKVATHEPILDLLELGLAFYAYITKIDKLIRKLRDHARTPLHAVSNSDTGGR